MSQRIVALLLVLTLLVSGCATVQSSSSLTDPAARKYSGSVDVVYSEAMSTLMALGWQVVSANKEERLIQARTPPTIWTLGDLVTVFLIQESPSTVRVDVTSASAQQFDWGKNTENIEKFYLHLSNAAGERK